ncbi:hypothetical protein [Roseibium algae]|uniref:Helix-turn-helix protein n=1 Tax=Roseibium algae TaxID=3123038 RepID=A0ABU8TJY4_9HYPH
MSDQAMTWAIAQDVPDPDTRDVLLTLANAHERGGLCLPTAEVSRRVQMDHFRVAAALWDLRNAGLIVAEGIGGLMSVTLGCDFECQEVGG